MRILQNKNPECRIRLHNLWMLPNVPCKEAHEFTYLERATISVHRYFTSKALRRVVKASPLLLFVVIQLWGYSERAVHGPTKGTRWEELLESNRAFGM